MNQAIFAWSFNCIKASQVQQLISPCETLTQEVLLNRSGTFYSYVCELLYQSVTHNEHSRM